MSQPRIEPSQVHAYTFFKVVRFSFISQENQAYLRGWYQSDADLVSLNHGVAVSPGRNTLVQVSAQNILHGYSTFVLHCV